MVRLWFVLLLTGGAMGCSFAQKMVWQAGVHSFFSNNEFAGSRVKRSQTMAGVHFVPQAGLSYRDRHQVFVGVDALHEFGSDRAVDGYEPLAYYRFDGRRFDFYMGAFPKKGVLENYPRMFFQDSVRNYRAVVNGLFWEYRSRRDDYAHVWLDWTSRQTRERRENFFMGGAGRLYFGRAFVEGFGYMFHFAGRMNPATPEPVHDNGLVLVSGGVDLARWTGFEKLELTVGRSAGYDRDRGSSAGWMKSKGVYSELRAEFRGVGVLNSFYAGEGQQYFYRRYEGLYWGDAGYRASKYDRADFYVRFIENGVASVRFVYSLHFLESRMFHEQSLYAVFDLDNLPGGKSRKYERFWSRWFDGNDDGEE